VCLGGYHAVFSKELAYTDFPLNGGTLVHRQHNPAAKRVLSGLRPFLLATLFAVSRQLDQCEP
jgi:hypothetical protein